MMKMLWFAVLMSALALGCCDDAEDAQTLADYNTDFALRFYKAVSPEADNMVFSPYSISTALTMAARGADGNTLKEMYKTLGFGDLMVDDVLEKVRMEDDVLERTEKLLNVLNSEENDYNISVANRLFGEKTFTFQEDFLTHLEEIFDSSLEKVDFVKEPEEARETINDWVEEKTNDKIKDFLPPGSVTTDTRLYLVNAIYFGAKWLHPFEDKDNLVDQDFYVSEDETEKVTYMHREGKRFNYMYAELPDLGASLLEMQYTEREKAAMYILLPDAREGLADLESKLEASHLGNDDTTNIYGKLSGNVKVNVQLPKFEMKQLIKANDILKGLGIVEAFQDKANFSRMADSRLKISDVVHKAFINVHEGGTEAAAATGIGIVATSLDPSEPKEFHADHPFIYIIREKTTGSILFMGRYKAPPSAGGELPRVGAFTSGAGLPSVSLTLTLLCALSGVITYMRS